MPKNLQWSFGGFEEFFNLCNPSIFPLLGKNNHTFWSLIKNIPAAFLIVMNGLLVLILLFTSPYGLYDGFLVSLQECGQRLVVPLQNSWLRPNILPMISLFQWAMLLVWHCIFGICTDLLMGNTWQYLSMRSWFSLQTSAFCTYLPACGCLP